MASRFAEVSEGEVVTIVEEGILQKTKEATSYVIKVFEGKGFLRNKSSPTIFYKLSLNVPYQTLFQKRQ